jgi:hypothetical protein
MPELILFIIILFSFGLFLLLNKTFDRSKKQIVFKSKDLSGVDYSFFALDTDWFEKIEKANFRLNRMMV